MNIAIFNTPESIDWLAALVGKAIMNLDLKIKQDDDAKATKLRAHEEMLKHRTLFRKILDAFTTPSGGIDDVEFRFYLNCPKANKRAIIEINNLIRSGASEIRVDAETLRKIMYWS